MRVVGLDLSLTATGLARADGSAVVLKPPKGCRGEDRMVWIRDAVLKAVITPPDGDFAADLVAIEGFSFGSKGNAVFQIGGIGWIIRVALHERRIRYVEIPPSVLKRYATGHGNANKPAMLMAAINRLGYANPKPDDNEVDALWLRALTLDAYRQPIVKMPQSQRDAAVKALSWPRVTAA